uniref:Uncharacterized protein n=1 Tax=Anguilla anguilla TaxID=7936 RepID=A0A0E9WCM0_ANGAN
MTPVITYYNPFFVFYKNTFIDQLQYRQSSSTESFVQFDCGKTI